MLYILHSASDYIDFKATLNAIPELPHCVTEFKPPGAFNLDNLEVCYAYVCSDVCVTNSFCISYLS